MLFLHPCHQSCFPWCPIVVPQKMKNAVNDQSRNLFPKTDTIVTCLLARPIEVHVHFSFQHLPCFQREGDNIRDVIMMQESLVECPASSGVNEHNRNSSLSRSQHPAHIGGNDSPLHAVSAVCIDHNNARHQRDLAVRLPILFLLRGLVCVFDPAFGSSRMLSVSESAMPESITSGPSRVKSPDSNARSTLA